MTLPALRVKTVSMQTNSRLTTFDMTLPIIPGMDIRGTHHCLIVDYSWYCENEEQLEQEIADHQGIRQGMVISFFDLESRMSFFMRWA